MAKAFDTLGLFESLKEADVPEKQARAIAEGIRDSQQATRDEVAKAAKEASDQAVKDLDSKTEKALLELNHKIDNLEQRLSAKITLLHWMLAVLVGGVGTLIVRSFTS